MCILPGSLPPSIKLNPRDAAAYNNRGIIKKEKGDLNGALAEYNQAVSLMSRSQHYESETHEAFRSNSLCTC